MIYLIADGFRITGPHGDMVDLHIDDASWWRSRVYPASAGYDAFDRCLGDAVGPYASPLEALKAALPDIE